MFSEINEYFIQIRNYALDCSYLGQKGSGPVVKMEFSFLNMQKHESLKKNSSMYSILFYSLGKRGMNIAVILGA